MSQTVFEAYNSCKKQLAAAGIEDEVFEAKQILKRVTGMTGAQIIANYNSELSEIAQTAIETVISQRKARYPLQYIFGSWDFYGREFEIGAGVLIPRADTETLVEKALAVIKDKENPQVLDLCAGSGCIGVTLAAQRKDSFVTMVEKYETAAGYAACNIANHRTTNTRLIVGDVFCGDGADGRYDLIVSNPPYITKDEMKNLQPEVRHEPETALEAGKDGLIFYREIVKNYKNSLVCDGVMAFEVGVTQADAVAEIMKSAGFKNVGFCLDASDIRRVVFGTADGL